MSNKLRKRARELAAREGISYQAAHNRLTEAGTVVFEVDEWVPLPPLDDARIGAGEVTGVVSKVDVENGVVTVLSARK